MVHVVFQHASLIGWALCRDSEVQVSLQYHDQSVLSEPTTPSRAWVPVPRPTEVRYYELAPVCTV